MPEPETTTGSDPPPSALNWVAKWLRSDLTSARPPAGEPATRDYAPDVPSTGANTTDQTVPPVLFAGYEILGEIGKGGMGVVYRARDPELDRVVALKVISGKGADDSAARARFEQESRTLAALKHPNVVTVYGAGTWAGAPYFTMEYVPGGALNRKVGRFKGDPAAAARLMAKVARAVQALHDLDILHRDLKPHNILLGPGDEPLVADFGLVKKLDEDSDVSLTGAPMGTRQYMSPEQTFASKADYAPACDIWAVGVILYELLAGVRPFPSLDAVEVYIQVRAANPKPLREHDPAIPDALAAVVAKCLQKNPSDRYPSAAAVAADLEAWLAGEAVTATLPPPPRPARRTGWYAAVAAAVVAAVAGVAVAVALNGRQPDPPPDPPAQPGPPPVEAVAVPQVAVPQVAPPPRLVPIARLLARGETVEFVGPSGGFRWPTRITPGSHTDAALTPEGFLGLDAVTVSAVELCDEPLPPGTRFEAEYAIETRWDDKSAAGVYAGGRSWVADGRPQATIISLLRFETLTKPNAAGEQFPVERPGFVMFRLAHTTNNPWAELPARDVPLPPPLADAQREWIHVSVTPGLGRVDGTSRYLAVLPAAGPTLAGAVAPRTPPDGPLVGNGVGLVVTRARAIFRNVRLVPPRPAPPRPVP